MTPDDPLLLCLQGRVTPEIAVARLLLAGESTDAIARRVREVRTAGDAWLALAQIVEARRPALDGLRTMLDAAQVDHDGPATPDRIAALFDRAMTVSPEGSVALYSLGDAERLAAGTNELVRWLEREGLLAPGMDVLDLGCGIGRMAAAVAGRARSVLGLDVSTNMVQEAARRWAELENVRFKVTAGADLSALPADSFDLLLAVDSFPYLVQAGVAERHFADAGRVLRDRGVLAILNFSYRGDRGADDIDARVWARRYCFEIRRCGIAAFQLWDAVAYTFVRKKQLEPSLP